MSNFEDFFSDYEDEHNCSPEKYECYEAGQQSKQAEIDELQKTVKELELINFDSELHFDHLQKKIDLALEKCYAGIRKQGEDYYLEVVQDILKG